MGEDFLHRESPGTLAWPEHFRAKPVLCLPKAPTEFEFYENEEESTQTSESEKPYTVKIVRPQKLIPKYKNQAHGGNRGKHAFPLSKTQTEMRKSDWLHLHRCVHDRIWNEGCPVHQDELGPKVVAPPRDDKNLVLTESGKQRAKTAAVILDEHQRPWRVPRPKTAHGCSTHLAGLKQKQCRDGTEIQGVAMGNPRYNNNRYIRSPGELYTIEDFSDRPKIRPHEGLGSMTNHPIVGAWVDPTWEAEQMTYHAFLIGARFNYANHFDKKLLDRYGVMLSKVTPGRYDISNETIQSQICAEHKAKMLQELQKAAHARRVKKRSATPGLLADSRVTTELANLQKRIDVARNGPVQGQGESNSELGIDYI